MKSRFVRITKPLLAACMVLSGWISVDVTSFLFFGECEYPRENPEE